MIRNSILLACCLLSLSLFGQKIPVGSWRAHLSTNNTNCIADAGSGVFVATDQMVFLKSYVGDDVEKFTKINGLSDQGVSAMQYDATNRLLILGYENGNLDILHFDGSLKKISIDNYPDLKNKNTTGSKEIKHILLVNNTAYLSTAFGIVVFDLFKREFKDTYIIGPNGKRIAVYSLSTGDGRFYAGTDNGILFADVNSVNLSDFNSWTRLPVFSGRAIKQQVFWNGYLVFGMNDTIYRYASLQAADTIFLDDIKTDVVRYYVGADQRLAITTRFRAFLIDTNKQFKLKSNYGIFADGRDIISLPNEIFWIADGTKGLLRSSQWSYEFVSISGPASSDIFKLYSGNERIWAVSGNVTDAWDNAYNPKGIYSFDNGRYRNFTRELTPKLAPGFDFLNICSHPSINKTYIGSWGWGIAEFQADTFNRYITYNNSALEFQPGSEDPATGIGLVRVAGVGFDSRNNMYVANYGVQNPLKKMDINGNWTSYRLSNYNEFIGMMIDSRDQKWLINRLGNGIVVNKTDNDFRFLTNQPGQGALPDPQINCIVEDKDGAIWIGTNKGPTIIYNPDGIFRGYNYDARQIKIQQGLYVGYLLGNEIVNTIAIDGANRKWIGTQNGAFLISADGQNQVLYFNDKNSPLFSNNVLSIAIDPITGEVFFATDKGVISYRADATEGKETNEDVYAFPNPVQPGYSGFITIKGLVANAFVKITDINGVLVYQSKANGGSISWDGKDPGGRAVASGVYLVFSINDIGEETYATKVLIVR